MTTYQSSTEVAQKLLDQQSEIHQLKFELESVKVERNVAQRWCAALENAGVDNWEGYAHALELLAEYEREDEE